MTHNLPPPMVIIIVMVEIIPVLQVEVHGTSINLHLSQWTLMYLKMASMLGKSWQLSCNPMLKVKKQAVHTDKSVKQNRGRGRLQILFLYTQDIYAADHN